MQRELPARQGEKFTAHLVAFRTPWGGRGGGEGSALQVLGGLRRPRIPTRVGCSTAGLLPNRPQVTAGSEGRAGRRREQLAGLGCL